MKTPVRHLIRYRVAHIALAALLAAGAVVPITAGTPGRGRTAAAEVNYLRFIINHHASALRLTELAEGSEQVRDSAPDPNEGTSASPGFPTTAAKSRLDQIKSMSRKANRGQRDEIAAAQRMLRDWYRIQHQPAISAEGRRLIDALESAPAGRSFDQAFLMLLNRHRHAALTPSLDCQINRELEHDGLDRYCRGIVHAQVNEITEMRALLCKEFALCRFQGSEGP